MDTKERHIRENESNEKREIREEREKLAPIEAEDVTAGGKRRRNDSARKTNKLWLWLGVLILIFILLWWLWSIGTFEAIVGVTNG